MLANVSNPAVNDSIAFSFLVGDDKEYFGVVTAINDESISIRRIMERSDDTKNNHNIHPPLLSLTIFTGVLPRLGVEVKTVLYLYQTIFTTNMVKHLKGADDIYSVLEDEQTLPFADAFSPRAGLKIP